MTKETFAPIPPLVNLRPNDSEILNKIQEQAFRYFLENVNRGNGLVADRSSKGSPASIATMGLALTIYPVGVDRGFMSREEAIRLTLAMLRFLVASPQSEAPDATGWKGFYYHFLDMQTGKRNFQCELSTIDTALLIAGMLVAAEYFDKDSSDETEIRAKAKLLFERVDWPWAMQNGIHFSHGWKPETGFLPSSWDQGYSEALILYVLALGSETFPLPPKIYQHWTSTFQWKSFYGHEVLYAGPLFIHQLPQVWLDFRGLQDQVMQAKGMDYFENSRRATLIQHSYAIENPLGFKHYGLSWGFTAGDGPGPCTLTVDGRERTFYGYVARGVPEGIDDGTISPWAAVTSLPFSPELVLDTIHRIVDHFNLAERGFDRFVTSYNPTFPVAGNSGNGWVSDGELGLNQGPMVLMIENARTGRIWQWGAKSSVLRRGLQRAGFTGGWLAGSAELRRSQEAKEL